MLYVAPACMLARRRRMKNTTKHTRIAAPTTLPMMLPIRTPMDVFELPAAIVAELVLANCPCVTAVEVVSAKFVVAEGPSCPEVEVSP